MVTEPSAAGPCKITLYIYLKQSNLDLTLQILLGMVSLICLLGGTNLLRKGAASFLPDSIPPPPILDTLFRFMSGIYFGLGCL